MIRLTDLRIAAEMLPDEEKAVVLKAADELEQLRQFQAYNEQLYSERPPSA